MTVTDQRAYWNRGVDAVPMTTGAASVMDCADIRDVCAALGIALPFTGPVLDVGCGTGRLAQLCDPLLYEGVDIAPDAVAYCRQAEVCARLITGPENLPGWFVADTVLCLSVFTHIDRWARVAYLRAFAEMHPQHLLVDIIPGDGSGTIALWTANWDEFQQDLRATGWEIAIGPIDRRSWDGPVHRYLWAERV